MHVESIAIIIIAIILSIQCKNVLDGFRYPMLAYPQRIYSSINEHIFFAVNGVTIGCHRPVLPMAVSIGPSDLHWTTGGTAWCYTGCENSHTIEPSHKHLNSILEFMQFGLYITIGIYIYMHVHGEIELQLSMRIYINTDSLSSMAVAVARYQAANSRKKVAIL